MHDDMTTSTFFLISISFRTFSPFISRDRDLEAIIKMSKASRMTVVKRDGREEVVHFDKITSRIEKLCYGLDMDYIDPTQITVKVINGLYDGVTTVELDNLAAEIAATIPQRLLNTTTMPSLLQGISQLFKF